jgi:hypothetical protein
MRLVVATALVCALVSPASAWQRRTCNGRCPPVGPMGIEYEFSLGVAQLSLAHETFANTIIPLDANHAPLPAETIAVTGRNVGAVRPLATVGELHVSLMHIAHLALGGKMGIIFGDFGKEVQTGTGALVNAGQTQGFLIGPEARYVLARGPFEINAGVSLGYRELWFDVPNRLVRCKGGVCHAQVSDGQFFFEPRVAVAVNLSFVSLGGYVGGDVMPTGGYVAGGFIAFRLGQWNALTDIHTWSAHQR